MVLVDTERRVNVSVSVDTSEHLHLYFVGDAHYVSAHEAPLVYVHVNTGQGVCSGKCLRQESKVRRDDK